MSATIIALLNASAETPGMPPCVISDPALTDADGDLIREQTDVDLTQIDLADAVGGEPAPEDLAPAADQVGISADVPTPGHDPDLWLYRNRTFALLRRYMRLSIAVGRMPSLLGREFFRARVTAYKSSTFEDSVIFVADVERSLEKLSELDKQWIAKVVL